MTHSTNTTQTQTPFNPTKAHEVDLQYANNWVWRENELIIFHPAVSDFALREVFFAKSSFEEEDELAEYIALDNWDNFSHVVVFDTETANVGVIRIDDALNHKRSYIKATRWIERTIKASTEESGVGLKNPLISAVNTGHHLILGRCLYMAGLVREFHHVNAEQAKMLVDMEENNYISCMSGKGELMQLYGQFKDNFDLTMYDLPVEPAMHFLTNGYGKLTFRLSTLFYRDYGEGDSPFDFLRARQVRVTLDNSPSVTSRPFTRWLNYVNYVTSEKTRINRRSLSDWLRGISGDLMSPHYPEVRAKKVEEGYETRMVYTEKVYTTKNADSQIKEALKELIVADHNLYTYPQNCVTNKEDKNAVSAVIRIKGGWKYIEHNPTRLPYLDTYYIGERDGNDLILYHGHSSFAPRMRVTIQHAVGGGTCSVCGERLERCRSVCWMGRAEIPF